GIDENGESVIRDYDSEQDTIPAGFELFYVKGQTERSTYTQPEHKKKKPILDLLPLLTSLRVALAPESGEFIAPNEPHPEGAKPILNQAISGIYISVGTERGFIAAALAQKITHLVLLDVDPGVVLFNIINIALLQMSDSQIEYVWLRLNAPYETWLERISRVKDPRAREILQAKIKDPETGIEGTVWDWWKYKVRENVDFSDFNKQKKSKLEHANYLVKENEHLFKKLHSMAKQELIEAGQVDLANPPEGYFEALSQNILSMDQNISVIDLSNAVDHKYKISLSRLQFLLDSLRKATTGKTILLFSLSLENWVYSAITYDKISTPNKTTKFVLELDDYLANTFSKTGQTNHGYNTLNALPLPILRENSQTLWSVSVKELVTIGKQYDLSKHNLKKQLIAFLNTLLQVNEKIEISIPLNSKVLLHDDFYETLFEALAECEAGTASPKVIRYSISEVNLETKSVDIQMIEFMKKLKSKTGDRFIYIFDVDFTTTDIAVLEELLPELENFGIVAPARTENEAFQNFPTGLSLRLKALLDKGAAELKKLEIKK
ncbi:MAG: hypothetical protein HY843_07195, partial [Bdellovibrio sp.]|nr:hypothetical protein [Bdellovibrio sp.]